MRKTWFIIFILSAAGLAVLAKLYCGNMPWPAESVSSNTFFTSVSSAVKGLDPATSYYVHESAILDNVVEAPLDYDYTARPYQLTPRLLRLMPTPRYFARDGELLSGDPAPSAVQRVEYRLSLRPNLQYQPHPCFAKDEAGRLLYASDACPKLPKHSKSPQDFPVKSSRCLRSEDFKVALIRLCDPRLASPVYATLSSFIAGMSECSQQIQQVLSEASAAGTAAQRDPVCLDYRQFSFPGLEIINDLEFTLVLSRKYPQALYWLAMHFFAPIPWEALEFYHLEAVLDAGFNWKNWPVGSGPFMLEVMDPNMQIRLCRNPNFRTEYWHGVPGVALPFLQRVVFQYERETIPNWIKFNQGYYDTSGIPSDLLDSATTFTQTGELALSQEMSDRGMKMHCSVTPTIFYFGFNMLDPLVGGNSENRRALRQAVSIVLDYQEYIDIFLNGQGVPAQCVIPPGISGSQPGNDFISPWNEALQKPLRLPLQQARELMQQAGYPNGIASDGQPLTLFLDHANAGAATFKAQFQWLKSKFALLGIQLEERATDLNRWRDKLITGNWQLIFNKGWLADYPDPENFLFLFYSDNAVVQSEGRGANYVNYSSTEFDHIFRQLETMPDSAARLALIEQACRILQRDAPCCWGYHPAKVILTQNWLDHYHPHDMSYSTLKYLNINRTEREHQQRLWNRPRLLPVYVALAVLPFLGFLALPSGKTRSQLYKKNNANYDAESERRLPLKTVANKNTENE